MSPPLSLPNDGSQPDDRMPQATNALGEGARAGINVLLVDDDRLVLATLGEGLKDAGYGVTVASSAMDAMRTARKGGIDIAILDVRMPEVDGIELAKQLRESTSIPFLFLSAYGDVEIVRRAADYGALGYLVKPVDIPQIVPSLEAALIRAREIGTLRQAEQRLATALAIEQKTRMAVGLLMERRRLDREAAFEALRGLARSQRRKIADVAEELLAAVDVLNAEGPRGPRR